jgi:Fe2+ transport system protein FeoA
MKLSEAKNNEKLRIVDLLNTNEYRERLHALGIIEGCEICPLRKENSNMIVNVRNCRYALGKEITDCILVKPI